mgnify:CR=1 FL=1
MVPAKSIVARSPFPVSGLPEHQPILAAPLLQVADGIVHILVSDFTDNLLDIEVLVFTQFNFRTERDQKGSFPFLCLLPRWNPSVRDLQQE